MRRRTMRWANTIDRWAYRKGWKRTPPRPFTPPTRATLDTVGGGGGDPGSGGEGGSGDTLPPNIKDFPSAARFTARLVALSMADDQWMTYNRETRRRLAAEL